MNNMPSATETAYEFIRSTIMSGELSPGDRVKEEFIAEEIGVSRTPIRHALQKLAAQGFIEMLHHHGARVTEWSQQELAEIMELRALLEGFGAGLAAAKITGDELEILRDLASKMENAADLGNPSDLEAITGYNSEFHMTIISASGNRRLAEVIGNLAHPLLIRRRFTAFSEARLRRSMDHHREIIDALAAGRSDWASAIMRGHLLASIDE